MITVGNVATVLQNCADVICSTSVTFDTSVIPSISARDKVKLPSLMVLKVV